MFHKFGSKNPLMKLSNLCLSLRKRTMTVWQSTEGLGLIQAAIKVFVDTVWNEQREATNGEGIF